jgi:hypothetical protein
MINQRTLIREGAWDILLVIDACRYDVFEEVYRDFFPNNGELKKVETPATWTGAWVAEIFHGHPMKDVVFVSAHKWINSKGPCTDKVRIFSERLKYGKMIREFDSRNYFKKVIDVWEFGYDEKIRAISPEIMTNETIKAIENHPKSKIISKYYQIHDPYLFYSNDLPPKKKKISFENLQNFIGNVISDEMLCRLRNYTGRLPVNALSYYYLKYGKEGVRKGYREDLKMMLGHCKKIVDKYPNKKIVITSDHGERLGEGGDFGHSGQRDKIMIEVPWFEISGRKIH